MPPDVASVVGQEADDLARILIADDDAHMVRLIAMWLVRNGHEVFETSNGRAAQELLARQPVDLVVSDVNMPGVDGIGLVRWIRTDARLTMPILLLSSRCDQSDMAAQIAQFGVRVHPKPFSPSRLLEEITRLLAAAEAVTG